MKDKNIILGILLLLAGGWNTPAHGGSGSSDGAWWMYFAVNTKPTPQWSVSYALEYRLKNHMSTTDLYCATVIADYQLSKRLEIGFGMEVFLNHNSGKYTWEYRYYPELIYSFPLGGFNASFRTRVMNTFEKWDEPNYEHRNRLKVSYPLPKAPFTPFVYVEPYNQLNGSFYKLKKIRAAAGCGYAFRKCKIDLYYLLERYPSRSFSRHVMAMDFVLNL